MADRGDTHFNLRRMNRWFMLSAFVLLASALWMVVDDWNRDWKGWQREFQAQELERARLAVAAVETPEWMQRKEELEQRAASVQARIESSGEYQAAEAELRSAEGRRYRTDAEFRIAQAQFNWAKFQLNRANAAGEGSAFEADMQAKAEALEAARIAKEDALAGHAAAEKRVRALTSRRDLLKTQLAELKRETERFQEKVRSLEPGLFKALRDAPGLDFVAPTIQVRKQVLPDLRKNYNFTTVQRVDMCASCHVAIGDSGYTEGENPLRAHPRLDLFIAPSSPHPVEKIGCTVCHEGAAETLDFVRAVHMPDSEEKREAWEEEHHWHRYHYWDWPMLPTKYTEAGCYSCHAMSGTLESIAADAPRLTAGLRLIEDYGCYACHNIQGWRVSRKPGPTLRNVRNKTRAAFVRSWVSDPRHFRPSSRMPRIFHLENSVSAAWDDTAIAAIQTYLWNRSEGPAVEPVPPALAAAADASRGEALFRQVGCAACHNSPFTAAHGYSAFGPDLAGIGSKLSEDWLYAWILDPTAWWPETRMPKLRLEPQQAADIARYLAGQKSAGWEPLPVQPDSEVLGEQARAFLLRRWPVAEAERILSGWEQEGQEKVLEEVGRMWINRQGCYSCHDIPGFEQGMPIGTDLSDWGNKNVHQLAFELWNEDVPGHFAGSRDTTRPDFAELKLSNPRRFDRGLEVAPLDRLRMPDFGFSREQIEALVTAVLGFKDDRELIRPAARPQPDELARALEQGAFLVRRNNCYGCHKFQMDTLRARNEAGDQAHYHGVVTLEDEDEEATFFQLWKTDPDQALEDEDGGRVGSTVLVPWQEDEEGDYAPWPVAPGAGGGILPGLAQYYVDTGAAGSDIEAFPLMPPILYREGEKVRAPWVTQFLLAPYTLRPWLAVKMPSFRLDQDEARSIAVYFAALAVQEWPSRYARELRRSLALSRAALAAKAGIREGHLRAIEEGGRMNQHAFAALQRWGDRQGFHLDPPPGLPFEEIRERSPAYLASLLGENPDYLAQGAAIVGPEGVNCYACHIRDGKPPGGEKLSWGPDLSYARDRLRPDWVRQWVIDAQQIYPGTKMPTAIDFLRDPKLEAILSGNALERVEAVKDFLMNSDRVSRPLAPGAGK